MKATFFIASLSLLFLFSTLSINKTKAQTTSINPKSVSSVDNENKLVVIWSSDDPMVAHRVALMYSHASQKNKWFEEVTLVIWGPSANLIAKDVKLQNKLKDMQKDGVIIKACIACANEYGVSNQLKSLNYDVIPMGLPLTNYLKQGYKVLSF